ncbi:MAG TPA: MarC family protein [Elusimicrobia bacterium]|nr:MAG: hypothetical protein A2278_09255 [Elusimicrobia bacterium RIFOXYA12_FULL_49_49]OGS10976.1 MAG: hypothetical protein A2386_06995 [Elusimicrobia bacterium RIFOXYB1_FULL_48_9]OGS14970.1 MAG: hypothetical protein A2251_08110 [Elusimicrobia bacterium RIFOXYA2_FULL_47_53]OGS26095.1 MAG: hypothetical protein A2339_02165 [Elusimicrobia bacterium RIFOXYB12_FULL_50_12]OGS29315.1 MAG: hypothetical protein A2323_04040 [Elusimicrobia bacterium RIFOXYB2_FULL_46_23]HBU70333.1 MarC family protein [Elu
MDNFWLVFVPLFVAVDAIGVLPMFLNLTEGFTPSQLRKTIFQSSVTAMAVAMLFLALGRLVLSVLGITVADFMIAGGALLFVISLNDMLSVEKKQVSIDPESLGAVPIGVPLIVGPAVLTTAILLVSQYGYRATALSAALNIIFAAVVFLLSGSINKFLGRAGAKTVSKLASLLLAAIAVKLIRHGIMIYLAK